MSNIFVQISNTAILRSGLTKNKNIIEAYERLFLTLADYKSYSTISRQQLKDDFMDFYNVSITNMFLGTFIQTMRANGYLKEKDENIKKLIIENANKRAIIVLTISIDN